MNTMYTSQDARNRALPGTRSAGNNVPLTAAELACYGVTDASEIGKRTATPSAPASPGKDSEGRTVGGQGLAKLIVARAEADAEDTYPGLLQAGMAKRKAETKALQRDEQGRTIGGADLAGLIVARTESSAPDDDPYPAMLEARIREKSR